MEDTLNQMVYSKVKFYEKDNELREIHCQVFQRA